VSTERDLSPSLQRSHVRRAIGAPKRSRQLWRVSAAVFGGAVALAVAILWLTPASRLPRRVVDFQQYRFGVVPGEFDFDATGSHGPVLAAGRTMWRTYADLFAPSPKLALIQASTLRQLDHYPIALLRDVSAADLMLFTYIKPMGGELRQSAGLVWRARDRNNYYAALVDASASRVLLLRMVGGRPQEIAAMAAPIEVEFQRSDPSSGRGWYSMRVEAVNDRIRVWVQGAQMLSVRDSTFRKAGRVGFITHADSVALFDDLEVQIGRGGFVVPLPRSRPQPLPPQKMHVAEVVPTDALYREPTRAFSGNDAYWRVAILDAHGRPVPAARVHVDVVGPDGAVRDRRVAMTGSDGLALFHYSLHAAEHLGVYTVRVTTLSHADRGDALYDPAANTIWSTSFSVNKAARTERAHIANGAP
jgi:hypothetical protein